MGESASTVRPVEFGERGDAMIGSGTVRERAKLGAAFLSGLGGRAGDDGCSVVARGREWASGALPYRLRGLGRVHSFVEDAVDDEVDCSSIAFSLARSSHLLRTASKLAPIRCDGAHRRVPVGVPVPFGLNRPVDCELLRASVPAPPRVEEVRSSRRVWYAKGPETLPDPLEPEELEGSILPQGHGWPF